jgi:hypothetical protein
LDALLDMELEEVMTCATKDCVSRLLVTGA